MKKCQDCIFSIWFVFEIQFYRHFVTKKRKLYRYLETNYVWVTILDAWRGHIAEQVVAQELLVSDFRGQ